MGSPRCIYVEVPGVAVPQGSSRIFKNKEGVPYLCPANNKLPAWRKAIVAAVEAAGFSDIQLAGPVYVRLDFILPKPPSVKRRWPHVKPDVDKLSRACLDALETAGVVGNDSQVVCLMAAKIYGPTPMLKLYVAERTQ